MAKVKEDSRTCFGIDYYDDEAEADEVGAKVTASGQTYNGGYFHGMKCGREKSRDIVVDGVQLYAVTVA